MSIIRHIIFNFIYMDRIKKDLLKEQKDDFYV